MAVKADYLQSIQLIERLHRQFLEVVKNELDRHGMQDINNIQAVILYNIGEDELICMLWANEIFDRDRPDTIAEKV